MPKRLIIIFSIAILAVTASPAFSAPDFYMEDIHIPSAIDSGMGGPYPTDNEGLETIFANPASFKSAETDVTFTDFSLLLKGPIFDITSLVISSMSGGGELTDILSSSSAQSILSNIYTGVELTGPIYFGYTGDGLGFGLFNNTDITLRESGTLALTVETTEDILLCGGYAFRIPLSRDQTHVLDAGVMMKGGVEGSLEIEKSLLELTTLLSDLSLDIVMKSPFSFSTLIGLDAGLLYTWEGLLSVGLTAQDIYSPAIKYTYDTGLTGFIDPATVAPTPEYGLIPFKLNAGVELNPEIPALQQYITDFRFLVAYDDILDFWLYPSEAENALLHIKTGLELTMLEILSVRVGMAEGLLNAGLSLDLQLFTLNAAMFGTELSSVPGLNPVYNMIISFVL